MAIASDRGIAVRGLDFTLNGRLFVLQGLSFFNALFNPTFNESDDARMRWLKKFKENGINTLRVFGQWDLGRGFVDDSPESTLYEPTGRLKSQPLERLMTLAAAAESCDMVVELALFASQSRTRLSPLARENAIIALTREMIPHRNVIFQIWNESSRDVLRHYAAVKFNDPTRLVTNSPGVAGKLGDRAQNRELDLLTPHTSRGGKFWKEAPKQIERLIRKYEKPVVDDEPARTGMAKYGGRPDSTPEQHISHIEAVEAVGGYFIYHHDMFQGGYGSPTTPPSGIPDPDFSPFHRRVFDYLRGKAEGRI
ncbi:MAG: hypothetical protein ACUVXI_09135 [bacterium]